MTIPDMLTGKRVLVVVDSPINGKLTVIKDLAWGTHIQDENGLTQSGGVAEKIWANPLKRIKKQGSDVESCLILGLGGGGIAKLVRKQWPEAKIVGVDVDPVIVDLGKKYLDLNKQNVEIHIQDAEEFINSQFTIGNSQSKKHKTHNLKPKTYDLICIDMYVQDNVPEKFKTTEFLLMTRSLLVSHGLAIFNRLYYGDKRKEAVKFEDQLAKVFGDITIIYPEANIMFVCTS